jgi:glycosyltransferase involved in cell wall biosynthesis
MSIKKLAIITSHPIQYNAPLFQLLTKRNEILIKVFYTWGETSVKDKFDPGFGKIVQWDIPLLEGYEYEFVENVSQDKGTHHFRGIVNPQLISQVDAFGPSAILVFGWAFQSHLKVLRHYHKKKLVLFRGDSTLLGESSFLKKQLRRIFLGWVYKHVDYALYVGRNNRDYFSKMGFRDKQLVFAPHAIDNERFSDNSESSREAVFSFRKRLGIDPHAIVFLFAGKLEKIKNLPILLRAFVRTGLFEKADLVIVGNGELEKELKEEFRPISSIHFLDFQNQLQMPNIYRIADVFVLPSWTETWGLSVNEAMACGRPVLISDHCGCSPDLVMSAENGYIFKTGDIEDLSEKLLLLYARKSSLKGMGQVSLAHIAGFSYQHICRAIEETVKSN